MTSSQRIDTVRVTEVLRDTVVQMEADSSMIKALIECDSVGQAHIRELIEVRSGQRMPPPKIQINANTLKVESFIDSMEIYLTLKDRYVEHKKVESTINTIEVNRLTLWQKSMYNLGCMSLGVIICFLGIKLLKLIKPL